MARPMTFVVLDELDEKAPVPSRKTRPWSESPCKVCKQGQFNAFFKLDKTIGEIKIGYRSGCPYCAMIAISLQTLEICEEIGDTISNGEGGVYITIGANASDQDRVYIWEGEIRHFRYYANSKSGDKAAQIHF
jgi:hypothetical protein